MFLTCRMRRLAEKGSWFRGTRSSRGERVYPADGRHELLTLDEAAEVLRVSKKTLRRRIDGGEIEVVRDRRLVLVPRASVTDYVARHTVQRTRPRQLPEVKARAAARPRHRLP